MARYEVCHGPSKWKKQKNKSGSVSVLEDPPLQVGGVQPAEHNQHEQEARDSQVLATLAELSISDR
jgi:hypothetical protein